MIMMKIVSFLLYFTIRPFILKTFVTRRPQIISNFFTTLMEFHIFIYKSSSVFANVLQIYTLGRVDFRIHGELVHINITRTVKCRALKMTPKNPPQVRERVGLLHSKYVPSTSCDARPECRAQNIFYGQFDDSSTRQIILHF